MTVPTIRADSIRGAWNELRPIFDRLNRRKIQNNTYARLEGRDIVIRYHETDILTYHGNDTVTINTDGWHTSTTANRFANWLPARWSVHNDRGVWNIFGPAADLSTRWQVAHFRLFDGMTITDQPRPLVLNYTSAPDYTAEDLVARRLVRQIREYADLYTAEICAGYIPTDQRPVSISGDCWYCLGVVDRGDHEHLLSHFAENYVMVSLLRNAYADRRYGNADLVLQIDLARPAAIREHVRRYLTRQLVPAGIPTVTGDDIDRAAVA